MGGAVGNTRNLMNDHTKRDDTISQTDPAKASNPYKWEELQCSGSHHFELAGLYDKCSRDMRLVLGAEVVLSHANACIAAGKKTPRVTQDLIAACKPLLLAARPKFKKDGSNLAVRKYNGIQAWRVDGSSERGNTLRRQLIATFSCDSTGTTWATANVIPLPQTAGTIEETTAEEEEATAADTTNAVGLGDAAGAEVPAAGAEVPAAAAAYGEDPAATAAAAKLAAKTLRWPMPAKCFADEGTFVWEDSSERAWAAFVPRPDSPTWSKLENALSTFKDTDPTLLHVGEGKTSGTCNVGGGGTNALCAGPTTEAACTLQSAGTCTVSEGGANAACAAATTVMACVGASSGTCAVTAGGTNAACAAATTADSCAAASGGGNAASACVFTAEADNACVFAPRVADACVFTPDSRTPDEISTELRTRALQRCQQDKTRRKTDMKNLDALIKATQALVDVTTAEMMRERKVDRFSLASTRAYEARKKARALLAKLKTERLAVGTTTGAPPASLCEMRDLLDAFDTSDTCKTIPRTGISATLRDGADLVCNLQATTIETGKKGHAQLWKLVTRDAVMAKWNAWVRAKDFSDLGHLHGHHWLGHLNFFYPGECSLIDVMHTFFRVVGSTMWSVLIKLYQQLDLRCAIDKNGVSRMGTLASHLENANSGARLGKSKVYPGSKREAPTIVKQATSHVHNDLVYNLDWTIGLGMKQQSSGTLLPIKTPHASDQAFCDSELAAARGWSAVSKYVRVLHYFLMFSPDELREFGFDTRASAGLWLQKTISKMYELAETLHPPRDLVKNGNVYQYSPFGTRSCTNLGHQIPKQYTKGVDHARENADGHERMQGPCRAAAAKTLSGMNNQGKCGPEQMLSNMDIAAALRRGDMKEADKWVKRAKKKMAAMYATLSVDEMRAAVDELTSMSVDEILGMPAGKTFKSASEMLRTDAGNLETLHQDMDEMLLVAPAPGERGVRDGDAPTPEELEAEEAEEAAAGTAATNEETWEAAQAEDVIPTTLGNDV
jgi:hypothetical protein